MAGQALLRQPAYDVPVFFGVFGTIVPRRSSRRFVALPAIDTRGDRNVPSDVERVRKATFDALNAQLQLVRHA
jgi:hypothetical protein